MVELEADTQIPIQSRDDMKHTDSHGRVGWNTKARGALTFVLVTAIFFQLCLDVS